MIVRVPSSAFGDEPVTGASMNSMPRSARRSAMRRAARGPIVDMSTHRQSSCALSAAPCSPSSTDSTWSPSTTIVITMSLRSATWAGDSATSAPCSAAQSRAFWAVRFQTTRSKPARARFAAMRVPMIPSPMKPTLAAIAAL